jgi:hypothetical protein
MNHPAQGVQMVKQPRVFTKSGCQNYKSTIKTSKNKANEHSYTMMFPPIMIAAAKRHLF